MPLILEFTFEDGTKLNDKNPSANLEIRREKSFKTYYFDKKLKSIQLDPMLETADIDTTNNLWTADKVTPESTSKFQVFKQNQENRRREPLEW